MFIKRGEETWFKRSDFTELVPENSFDLFICQAISTPQHDSDNIEIKGQGRLILVKNASLERESTLVLDPSAHGSAKGKGKGRPLCFKLFESFQIRKDWSGLEGRAVRAACARSDALIVALIKCIANGDKMPYVWDQRNPAHFEPQPTLDRPRKPLKHSETSIIKDYIRKKGFPITIVSDEKKHAEKVVEKLNESQQESNNKTGIPKFQMFFDGPGKRQPDPQWMRDHYKRLYGRYEMENQIQLLKVFEEWSRSPKRENNWCADDIGGRIGNHSERVQYLLVKLSYLKALLQANRRAELDGPMEFFCSIREAGGEVVIITEEAISQSGVTAFRQHEKVALLYD